MCLKSQNANASRRGLCSLVLLPSRLLLHKLRCLPSFNCHMSQCVIFKALDTPESQPTYTTPKDQSILTTAPKALLVDDQFVDLRCSHVVLLFPSAVPSLGERSHLASLPLKHKKAAMSLFRATALWFRPVKILVLLSFKDGTNPCMKSLLQHTEGWRTHRTTKSGD